MSDGARRLVLRRGVQLLAGLTVAPMLVNRSRAAAACSTETSESLRESLNYKEPSPLAEQTCGGCSFYTAAGNCGSCSIMSDNVSPQGHCDSWAPKG
jgi:hypothetical protein